MARRPLFDFDRENWCYVFRDVAEAERDLPQLQERVGRFVDERHIRCASEDVIDLGNAILEAEWERRWPKRPRWLASRLHGDAPPTL